MLNTTTTNNNTTHNNDILLIMIMIGARHRMLPVPVALSAMARHDEYL